MNKIKLNLLILLSILVMQNKLSAQTSQIHKNNMGKTLFSKTEVLYQKEAQNTWVNTFNWGDPIYARMYWQKELAALYQENSWQVPYDGKYRYVLRFYANGKFFKEQVVRSDGDRTTLPLCLFRTPKDTYDWSEMKIVENSLNTFKIGKNTINVELCPYNKADMTRSKAVSSGSFTLNVTKEQMAKARSIKLKAISPKYPNSNDAWKEWEFGTSWGTGIIKSKYEQWEFTVDNISGIIKKEYSNWIFESTYGKVTAKQKNNDWKMWEISNGSKTLTLQTTWSNNSDAWAEWDLKSNKGTMKIKTKYSNSDYNNGTGKRWQDWEISDNMRLESPELKFLAVFIVINHAMKK